MKSGTKKLDNMKARNGDLSHGNGCLIVKENFSPDVRLVTNRQRSHEAGQEIIGLSACDIEWQWTSPNGTAPKAKQRVGKLPLQHMETMYAGKSISPINNIPRKRKLVKSEENEPIHIPFMKYTSSEGMSSSGVQSLPENCAAENIESFSTDNECNVKSLSDESMFKQKSDAEIYSSLLDDTDSFDDCLVKCSQYVEERLSQNPTNLDFSPIKVTTPRRSQRVKLTTTPNRNSFQLKLSRAKVHSSDEGAAVSTTITKSSQDTETNCCILLNSSFTHNTNSAKVNTSVSTKFKAPNKINQDTSKLSTPSVALKEVSSLPTSNLTVVSNDLEIENDSFENILVTFCEENFELLSQSSHQEKQTNDVSRVNLVSNSCEIQIDSKKTLVKAITPIESSNVTSAQEVSTSLTNAHKSTLNTQLIFADNFDGDDLQPDLLKLLESVEANLQHRSLPILCTPEEIEKKRQQAKVKLQRKKNAQLADVKKLPTMR